MATVRWLAMPTRAGAPAAGGRVGREVERAGSGDSSACIAKSVPVARATAVSWHAAVLLALIAGLAAKEAQFSGAGFGLGFRV